MKNIIRTTKIFLVISSISLLTSCGSHTRKSMSGVFEDRENNRKIVLTETAANLNSFGYSEAIGTYEIKNDELAVTLPWNLVVVFKILNKNEIKCILAPTQFSCQDVIFVRVKK